MSKARDIASAIPAPSTVSSAELGYLDGVTSAIQTQIDAKAPSSTAVTLTGTQTLTNKTLTNPVIASVVNNTLTSTTGDMIYASAANTPARLAIGSTDQVLKVTGGIPAWSTPVASGLTWTSRSEPTGTGVNSFAYNGSTIYVAVGDTGQLYSSTDSGVTWTSRTSQFGTSRIYDVFFGNSLFVAVGEAGKISTSTDGITWTARTSNMSTNDLTQVIYANSLWVVVGSGGGTTNTGGLAYSSDGITWTRKSQSLTVGANYQTVVWNGTNWIIGSNVSTNNYLYATTPSGTWTAAQAFGGNTIYGLWHDGTRTIASNLDSLHWTTGATLSSTTQYSNFISISLNTKSARLFNGILYTAGGVWLQNFTTASVNYPNTTVPTIAPGIYPNSSNVLQGASVRNFVTAAGQLIGTGTGRIYTSF